MSDISHTGGYEVLNHLVKPDKKTKDKIVETLKQTQAKLTSIEKEVEQWLRIDNDALFH